MVGGASVHTSQHSLFRLKITVGCRLCAYPSIHVETLSRSRSVDWRAHIRAFTFFFLKITVGCLTSTYPSIHVETLKMSVGCPPCTYPSIHPSPGAGTLKITVGCLTSTYPSIRNKNLHTSWTPWSTQETRGLWARPPVLTPVQAFHSRACLNLHHSDIQGTAQKSPCVNTFLRPSSRKKKKENLLVTVWEPGQDTQNKDNGHVRHHTRDNGHLRQQRAQCHMMMVVHFC